MTDKNSATGAKIDLDKLEKLAQAATPGPWKHHKARLRAGFATVVNEVQPEAGEPVVRWPGFDGMHKSKSAVTADARFIAAANPATVLDLIALARAGQQAGEKACSTCGGSRLVERAFSSTNYGNAPCPDCAGQQAGEAPSDDLRSEVAMMYLMLDDGEWTENHAVTPHGQCLETAITRLVDQNADLRDQLASAQKDVGRVEWMAGSDFVSLNQYATPFDKEGSYVGTDRLYFQVVIDRAGLDEFKGDTIREAIDAARQLTNPTGK